MAEGKVLNGQIKASLAKLLKSTETAENEHRDAEKSLEALIKFWEKSVTEGGDSSLEKILLDNAQNNVAKTRTALNNLTSSVKNSKTLASFLRKFLDKKEKKKMFYRKTHPKIYKTEKLLDEGSRQAEFYTEDIDAHYK